MHFAPMMIWTLLILASATACGPRYARVPILDQGGIKVLLRNEVREGAGVERGFDHPISISGVRLAHILATIDVRMTEGDSSERRPAVDTSLLFSLGDAVSTALGRADSTQEVVVMATRKQRRFQVFTQDFLTSFVAYVKDGLLYLYFGHVDWQIPKGPDPKIPEPWERDPGIERFKLIAAETMTAAGSHGVAVDWRDPSFRDAAALRFSPSGVKRRTILLDERDAPDEARKDDEHSLPADLTPETLRELADLEEARRAGAITEAQYKRRRREILQPR